MKLTLNPKGQRVGSDDEDDDVNPFQREDQSPIRDIETMDIEVNAQQRAKNSAEVTKASERSSGLLGEPEPEMIKSSDDDENSTRLSNFKNNHQFSNISKPEDGKKNLEGTNPIVEDEIDEDIEGDDEKLYGNDFEEYEDDNPEERSI